MKKKLTLAALAVLALCSAFVFAAPRQALAQATPVAMFRLYNPNSGEHFYTSNQTERKNLITAGWKDEGLGWTAPSTSKTPVYRLYSGTDHHYTTSLDEKNSLVKAGWKYEGIGWYSDDAKAVPLYRQYNPNVNPRASKNNSGSHNYTTSKAENDSLVKAGWRAEGVGWYGMSTAGYTWVPDVYTTVYTYTYTPTKVTLSGQVVTYSCPGCGRFYYAQNVEDTSAGLDESAATAIQAIYDCKVSSACGTGAIGHNVTTEGFSGTVYKPVVSGSYTVLETQGYWK